MKQAEVMILSRGNKLMLSSLPIIRFHNEYFGGGMSSIVFQDMRESKALAYSVYSTYTIPKDTIRSHYLMSYIGTQSDKLEEAMIGMNDLLDNMPEAISNMTNAKDAIEQKIRTERLTKSRIISEYLKHQNLGVKQDMRIELYQKISSFDMTSLKDFHQSYISQGPRTILVLGSQNDIDMSVLEKYGEIINLSLEDVFGY